MQPSRHPRLLADLLRERSERAAIQVALAGGAVAVDPGTGTSPSPLLPPASESGDALVAGVGPLFEALFLAQYVDAEFVLDGGGGPISAGIKMDLGIDFACVAIGWTLLLDQADTVRLDLWKAAYAGYPPVVGNTMPGANANKPQTTAAAKATGGVAGWTIVALAAGDIIRLNLDLVTVAGRATLALKLRRT